MVTSNLGAADTPTSQQAQKILADTAHAVKVMKASWLRVAVNLKKIREHDLWKQHRPACESYEDYVFGVLKLNKYVANRMMQAMDYTSERRPGLIDDYFERGDEVEIPSYEVVNQLRRAEDAFRGHEEELRTLENRVFDEGVGRVVLKREIDERLAAIHPDAAEDAEAAARSTTKYPSLNEAIQGLLEIESALLEFGASKEARKLLFQLVETLQREQKHGVEAGEDDA